MAFLKVLWRFSNIVLAITIMLMITPSSRPSRLHPSQAKQSQTRPSMRSRRDGASGCRHPKLQLGHIDVDVLKKQVAVARRAMFPLGLTSQFNFSKLECPVKDLDCPCINRDSQQLHRHYYRRRREQPQVQAILGGQTTQPQSLPWMVYIKASTGKICMGFLISYQFALTAGRCLTHATYINVTMGLFDLSRRSDGGAFLISISSDYFSIQPGSVGVLGLIQIANGWNEVHAMVHPHISPACLRKYEPHNLEMDCFGAGWATMGSNPDMTQLQWVQLRYTGKDYIHVFAKTRDDSKPSGLCEGDAGSPLMCVDEDGVTRVYGVLVQAPASCDSRGDDEALKYGDPYARGWLDTTMKERLEKSPTVLRLEDLRFEKFTWHWFGGDANPEAFERMLFGPIPCNNKTMSSEVDVWIRKVCC